MGPQQRRTHAHMYLVALLACTRSTKHFGEENKRQRTTISFKHKDGTEDSMTLLAAGEGAMCRRWLSLLVKCGSECRQLCSVHGVMVVSE